MSRDERRAKLAAAKRKVRRTTRKLARVKRERDFFRAEFERAEKASKEEIRGIIAEMRHKVDLEYDRLVAEDSTPRDQLDAHLAAARAEIDRIEKEYLGG